MRRRLLSLLLVFVLVLGMLPASAFADEVPFSVVVNGTEVTDITVSTLEWNGLTCYTVTVPEGSTEATLMFEEDKQWSYYDRNGTYLGSGETSWSAAPEHTVAIADQYGPDPTGGYDTSTPDGVLDGISVQIPEQYIAEFFVEFVYSTSQGGDTGTEDPEEPSAPFLNIRIGDALVAEENIEYKGIFMLGDYDEDEQQENMDSYNYVHEVPYYHVTVPCGTASVDVTYSADANIMNYGSDAYGYKTDLEVDAMTSATVRGTTFKDGYTKNEDGTQTVRTPVTGNTFDAQGKGHAITLEENDSPFAAVCLFSFEYDGKDHVYDNGKVTTQPGCESEGVKTFSCSCGHSYTEPVDATGHSYVDGVCGNCGGADPDYVAPGGAEIPADAPFTALTTDAGEVGSITRMDDAVTSYGDVPYYHVQIPASATKVYVTHPEAVNPFCDVSYNSAYGYAADTEMWGTSMLSFAFEAVDGGYKIELPLSATGYDYSTWEEVSYGFVADEDGYVGYAVAVERNGNDDGDYSPICFFSFEYAAPEAGEHVHSYDEGIVTTQPGCVTKGVKTFTCSGCTEGTEGHSYTEEIQETGHSYNDGVETIPATCEETGIKVYTCTKCTADTQGHTKEEILSKLGHKYDEGRVTKEPTCTVDGVRTYTCSQCAPGSKNNTKTETITKLGHDYQDGVCGNCGDVCPQQDENGVFQIGTAKELLWFAKAVNGGNRAISAVLTADITLDADWPGIGNSGSRFAGSFDGQNHTVTLSGGVWGLFGYTQGTYDSNGNAKVVAVVQNVIIDGTVKNSALIQDAGFTHITNCINKADIVGGNAKVAGIVGDVTGYNKAGYNYSDVLIQNCGNEGDILGSKYAAGIVGYSQTNTRVHNCYNTGSITGNNYVGGLVGFLQETRGTCEIKNSYNRGTVSGTNYVGGICGQTYNGVTIENCYNAGESAYGITGGIYNKTASIVNCYYLATASTMGMPANSPGTHTCEARTLAEMNDAAFIEVIGSSFQLSCPTPVLTWQEAVEHTGMGDEDGCDVCGYGSNIKQSFAVTMTQGTGYTVSGEETATQGDHYTFTVTIAEGYRRKDNFAVKVNGEVLAESTERVGSFTYENVQGPLSITVEGVEKIPDSFTVSLPNGQGKGYRVTSVSGSSVVAYGSDFRFRVTMEENFQEGASFQVLVNGSEAITPDAEGIYTLTNVLEDKTITVTGVAAKPYADTARIMMTLTKGENTLYKTPQSGSNQMLIHTYMDVPYFDISLYGLDCYYNAECYGFNEDGSRKRQTAGDAESAYGKITALHAFIYATEVHYLGLDESLAGTGLTYQDGRFQKVISWSGGVGSIFMKLWDHGTNLNYYVNYEYPLGAPGWGSTSDQILLKDGDMITAHMITSGDTDQDGNGVVGSGASGSAYGMFVVNDDNGAFDFGTDTMHRYTVAQGEEVNLTLYASVATSTYDTLYSRLGNQQLYWIHDDDLVPNLYDWNVDQTMVTDENGNYVLDTSGFEPGTYYIGAMGGQQEGDGKPDASGFVATGYERGPAVLILTVTEGQGGGEEEPELASGDVNGDGFVTADDAAAAFAASKNTEGLTEEQKKAADVNGDGFITADDAAQISAMSKGGMN